jgi:hypothetical protein
MIACCLVGLAMCSLVFGVETNITDGHVLKFRLISEIEENGTEY